MANNLAIPIPSTCTHKGIHTQGGGNLSTWREPQSQHVIMLYPERNIKLHIKLQHSCHCCGDWCFCPGGIVSVFCCLLSCNLFFLRNIDNMFSSIFWVLQHFLKYQISLLHFSSFYLSLSIFNYWNTKNFVSCGYISF